MHGLPYNLDSKESYSMSPREHQEILNSGIRVIWSQEDTVPPLPLRHPCIPHLTWSLRLVYLPKANIACLNGGFSVL